MYFLIYGYHFVEVKTSTHYLLRNPTNAQFILWRSTWRFHKENLNYARGNNNCGIFKHRHDFFCRDKKPSQIVKKSATIYQFFVQCFQINLMHLEQQVCVRTDSKSPVSPLGLCICILLHGLCSICNLYGVLYLFPFPSM